MLLLHIAQNADAIIHAAQVIPANVHHVLQPAQHLIPQDCVPGQNTTSSTNCTANTGGTDPYQNILNFANNILGLLQILALIIFGISIAIADMMRMMSFGGQQRIMVSNMAMTSAVVGLVIVVIATLIRAIIIKAF